MKLICYLSNGYPNLQESLKIAKYYEEGGCDIIEIDLPSRNPYLESEYIAGRMAKALEICDNCEKYMENIIKIKNSLTNIKVILLSYEDTIEEIGVNKFIDFCNDSDIKDIILVGLKNEVIKNQIIDNGLKVSCYVQLKMDEKEIEQAKASNGFVYMQAKGTFEQINPKYPTLKDCIAHLRKEGIDREIYCGVGIATPKDFKMVMDSKGDGAFVGSTILKLYDQPEKLRYTIKSFKEV